MASWARVVGVCGLAILVQLLFQHEYKGDLSEFSMEQQLLDQLQIKRPNIVLLTAEDM